jgi:hypothetical protein
MAHRKIANWTMIRNMFRQRFAENMADEVEVRAMDLAHQHADEEVATFKHEGEVAEKVMEAEASVAIDKMHTAATRKAMETMAKEDAKSALREIRHEAAMASLEAVAKEAAKVALRELRQGVILVRPRRRCTWTTPQPRRSGRRLPPRSPPRGCLSMAT